MNSSYYLQPSSFNELPYEIGLQILLYVDFDSLNALCRTCVGFYGPFKDSYLWQEQWKRRWGNASKGQCARLMHLIECVQEIESAQKSNRVVLGPVFPSNNLILQLFSHAINEETKERKMDILQEDMHVGYYQMFKIRYLLDCSIPGVLQTIQSLNPDLRFRLMAFCRTTLSEVLVFPLSQQLQQLPAEATGDLYHAAQLLHLVQEEIFEVRVRQAKDLEEFCIALSDWYDRHSTQEFIQSSLDLLADSIVLNPTDSIEAKVKAIALRLFSQEFTGNTSNYYNVSNSILSEILRSKKGIPISLSAIFLMVCSRLGLDAFGINFPGHFLTGIYSETGSIIFIDCFKCSVFGKEQLRSEYDFSAEVQPAKFDEMKLRMLRNLFGVYGMTNNVEKLLEISSFMIAIDPQRDILATKLQLMLNNGTDTRIIKDFIIKYMPHETRLLSHISDSEPQVRNKQGNAYLPGLIIKHKKYHYYGVITGFDEECEASPAWVSRMGVDKLTRGTHQPFYHVEVDIRNRPGHTSTYVAEDNISIDSNASLGLVQNRNVGKYFERFDSTTKTYILNSYLLQFYPQLKND